MGDAWKRLQIPILENRRQLTLAGALLVHAGALDCLTVGSEEFRNIRVVLSPESVGAFADGLLPTTLFQSLYINNRESFVVFNPRAKRETGFSLQLGGLGQIGQVALCRHLRCSGVRGPRKGSDLSRLHRLRKMPVMRRKQPLAAKN